MLVPKVLAYITRVHDGHLQLLTFTERDHPEAGVQIPAGTVKPGEDIEQALFREIAEESGLTSIFEYSWTDLESGTRLAGEQDRWLNMLLRRAE